MAFFVLVFVLGEDFIFVWLELVELFRLYLGASLCIFSFSSCHIIFVRLYMLGGVYFVVLVSNFLLIYDYEFFIIICHRGGPLVGEALDHRKSYRESIRTVKQNEFTFRASSARNIAVPRRSRINSAP